MSVYTGERPGRQRGVSANVGLLTVDNSLIDDVNLTVKYWFNATSGDYILSYGGNDSAAIAWDDDAAAVETAIELITGITAVTVTGSGTRKDPFSVLFVTPGDTLTPMSGTSSLVDTWQVADRA